VAVFGLIVDWLPDQSPIFSKKKQLDLPKPRKFAEIAALPLITATDHAKF
jgi:hypothetical protein